MNRILVGLLIMASCCALASAGPVTVAVVGDEKPSAAVRQIETLLTHELSTQKNVTLVDRAALQKVLAERASDNPLRAAGVLVCIAEEPKSKLISIEAVLAQTGQQVAAAYLLKDSEAERNKKLRSFCQAMLLEAPKAIGRPRVSVRGKLAGTSQRLGWMLDDCIRTTEASIQIDGVASPARVRHPLHTREERLLRVTGLSDAAFKDKTAGLQAASEYQVAFTLTDSMKTGVAFESTPITLKIKLNRGRQKLSETTLKSTVGKSQALQKQAAEYVTENLRQRIQQAAGSKLPAPEDPEEEAARLAQAELDRIGPLASQSGQWPDSLPMSVRKRVAHGALRASHLDPTNEQAAFLSFLYLASLHNADLMQYRDGFTLPVIDRVLLKGNRYLEQFGDTNKGHHWQTLVYMLFVSHRGPGLIKPEWKKDDLLRPPVVQRYPYVSTLVRVSARHGYLQTKDPKNYEDTNGMATFGMNLVNSLIPCIPEEKLQEEYTYWKAFYDTEVADVIARVKPSSFNTNKPVPWALVDAAFQARFKNPTAVRKALEGLAGQYPLSEEYIWGGTRNMPDRKSLFLRAAGDKEWTSWTPKAVSSSKYFAWNDARCSQFLCLLAPQFPRAYRAGKRILIPAERFVIPDSIRATYRPKGKRQRREGPPEKALLSVGNDVWLTETTGGRWSSAWKSRSMRMNARLFRSSYGKASKGVVQLAPEILPWPARPEGMSFPTGVFPDVYDCVVHQTPAGQSVFLVTSSGLVRFDRKSNEDPWSGRWYTDRDGLPTMRTEESWMVRATLNEKDVLLVSIPVHGSGFIRQHLVAWDISDNTFTIFHKGQKGAIHMYASPIVVLKDGRRVFLRLLQTGVYGPVDLKQFDRFVREGSYEIQAAMEGSGEIWEGGRVSHPKEKYILRSRSTQTGKVKRQGFVNRSVSIFPDPRSKWCFPPLGTTFVTPAVMSVTPSFRPSHLLAGKDVYWMSEAGRVWGFKPGEKSDGSEDTWYGPLHSPDGSAISDFYAGSSKSGAYFLVTRKASYLLRESDMIAACKKAGLMRTSGEYSRQQIEAMKGADWKAKVAAAMIQKRFDDGLKLLDAELAKKPNADEKSRIDIWRALLLMRKPDGLDEAIGIYKNLCSPKQANPYARTYGHVARVGMLWRAKRYAEIPPAIEQAYADIPQLKLRSSNRGLNRYMNNAKKKMEKK